MTQQIMAVASPLGISIYDHIIVGKDGHASMKGLKLILPVHVCFQRKSGHRKSS